MASSLCLYLYFCVIICTLVPSVLWREGEREQSLPAQLVHDLEESPLKPHGATTLLPFLEESTYARKSAVLSSISLAFLALLCCSLACDFSNLLQREGFAWEWFECNVMFVLGGLKVGNFA